MEGLREKLGRSWRIRRRKRNRAKGCKVRGRKRQLAACLVGRGEKEKRGGLQGREERKTKAGDGQAGSEEPAGKLRPSEEEESGEAGPESPEGRQQRELEAGDPEGRGPSWTVPEGREEEKRAAAEKGREREQLRRSRGAAEPEQQREIGRQEDQALGGPPEIELERREEDTVAAELGGMSLELPEGRRGEAEPGSAKGERREEPGVVEDQQEQRRAGAAAGPGGSETLKEQDEESEAAGISERPDGAGDALLGEQQPEVPREILLHESGAGNF